jgi:hypothetical protein
VTAGQHLLHIPHGLAACTYGWCGSLALGYDVAIDDDGVTLNFGSAADRARLLATIKGKCAVLRRYNPALAALVDEVR